MNDFSAALAALSALISSAAPRNLPEAAETILRPTSDWVVEHADWSCVLNRQLNAGDRRAFFSVTTEPLTKTAWVRVAIEGRAGRRGDGEAVMFGDGQRRTEVMHYNYFQAEGPYQIREFLTDLNGHSLAAVEGRLRFWTWRHGDIELELPRFSAAWRAMDACMSDLYETFGVSEGDLAQIATEPEGSIFQFVRMARPVEGFHVVLFYWVTPAGRVENCRILQPSGNQSFDQNLCSELQENARLIPARNAAGEAIRAPRFENARIRRETYISASPR